MANTAPFFLTGANAKIRLNNKTLAFCTDLAYSVQVLTKTPKVLGVYEGTSVEPLGYSVSGSFTVVRYVKNIEGHLPANSRGPQDAAKNDAGNGVGNWANAWGDNTNIFAQAGLGTDGRANEALNPGTFANGTTFDIQVFQKTSDKKTLGVANIRNCRINQADFQISKKNVAIQRFSFVALYVDEDSFTADFSGVGQTF